MTAPDISKEHLIETYKSLITISVEGFKYLALVNGGAAIALMSFVNANCVGRPDVRAPMVYFSAGLGCVGIAMVMSYWTQLELYAQGAGRRTHATYKIFQVLAVLCVIGSLVCFGVGSVKAVTFLQM